MGRSNSARGLACAIALVPGSNALAIQWESQADRLQYISATLLDAVPVPRPMKFNDFGLGLSGDVSFLPKLNTTVGAKTEKVPQATYHMIPTLEALGAVTVGKGVGIGLRAYGGFLPPMPKFLSGVDAKLTQWDYGAVFDATHLVSRTFTSFLQFGWHSTAGKVKGKIASKHSGTDTFEIDTRLMHLSAGSMHRKSRIYAAYMLGLKNTRSKLYIEEDDTELELTDTLKDARLPVFSQATVGWAATWGPTAALSFLYVPNRLYVPRLTLGYTHFFKGPSAKSGAPDDGDSEGEGATSAPPASAPTGSSVPTGSSAPSGTPAAGSTGAGAGAPATGGLATAPSAATETKGTSETPSSTGTATPPAPAPSAPAAEAAPAAPSTPPARTAPSRRRRPATPGSAAPARP